MLITKKTKLAEVIHQNYHLIPIITRFGINFGFGDKNVEQICEKYNIRQDFFLEIINAFNDEDYSPINKLQNLPLEITVNYLLKSHQYFNKVKLPHIENLISKLEWISAENKKNKSILNKFFIQYRKEVTEHTLHEENEVYPFIIEIEKNYNLLENNIDFSKLLENKSVIKYAETHDELNTSLLDLKNIIIKYLPPSDNIDITEQILNEIFDLEKDMKDHTDIENSVVIPVAIKMENELRKRFNLK